MKSLSNFVPFSKIKSRTFKGVAQLTRLIKLGNKVSEMEGGSALFRKNVPFHMELEGCIDGENFKLDGKGFGNSHTGYLKGKWVCKAGRIPMSWPALAPTLGSGFKCFANYPNGIKNFYQESMPEGWIQERSIAYGNDGEINATHDIFYQKGVVVNKVQFRGEGFKENSMVINDGIRNALPVTETIFPYENGVKSVATLVYPLRKTTEEFVLATMMTTFKPKNELVVFKLPHHHFIRSQLEQFKDIDDDREHIIQHEAQEAQDFNLLREGALK